MVEKIKIKDEEDLVRDPLSRAVLNTNNSSLEKYRTSRSKQRDLENTIKDVQGLKRDMILIKDLLEKISEKLLK
jgi:hypothetical protein